MSLPPLVADDRTAAIAIDARGEPLDRSRISAAVASIGAALHGRSEVVLACDDRLAFVHAALATWACNAVVTLPINLLPATVEQLARARPHALVVHDGAQRVGHDVGQLADSTDHPPLGVRWDPARPFVRLSTSGTTGVPKMIEKTAGQLIGEALQLARSFDITGARVLCTVPPHHIYGLLFGVVLPLVADATIVALAALHPEAVRRAIDRFGVDVLVSTPAQLRAFDVLDRHALAPLRRLFSSGAPLATDTATMLRDSHGIAATEVFGSSETGGIATRVHETADPPWTPIPGVEVTADREGRLQARSPWLDPAAPHLYVTDDRITIVPGGFIHVGRIDDVVKVGGRRVALGDITAKVLEMPGVTDAAAIAMPAQGGRGQSIGVIVATTTHGVDEVRATLGRWFDAAVVPRRIVCVPALPREPTGKLVRARMLALFGDATDAHDPKLRAIHIDPVRAVFDVDIDAALPCFAGHFPDDPILPAAVLLEAVVQQSIAQAWPALGAPTRVQRAKFNERIIPGDHLRLTLDRAAAVVVFAVDRGDTRCASGTLVFGAVVGDPAAVE